MPERNESQQKKKKSLSADAVCVNTPARYIVRDGFYAEWLKINRKKTKKEKTEEMEIAWRKQNKSIMFHCQLQIEQSITHEIRILLHFFFL